MKRLIINTLLLTTILGMPLIMASPSIAKAHRKAVKAAPYISESSRKAIYYAICQSDADAERDANDVYPTNRSGTRQEADQSERNMAPYRKLFDALTEKYHARVCRKYHLTEQQFSDIAVEGIGKNWPTPFASRG